MASFCLKDTVHSKVLLYWHEYCEIGAVVQGLLFLPSSQTKGLHCWSVFVPNYDSHIGQWKTSVILPYPLLFSICSQMMQTSKMFFHLPQPNQIQFPK